MLSLTEDTDPEVRDWAVFGLGVLGDADTPEVRDALAARLFDVNQNAREEAVVSSAKRKDQRTIQPLLELLKNPDVSVRALEAASLMLGGDHPAPEMEPDRYIQILNERFV